MHKPWFDAETGHLLFDEHILEMASFQPLREEGVVSEEDVQRQALRVAELLRQLEAELPPATRRLAGEALCELAVLYALHARSSLHAPPR